MTREVADPSAPLGGQAESLKHPSRRRQFATRLLLTTSGLLLVCLCLPDYARVLIGRFPLEGFGDDFHLFYAAALMASLGDPRAFEPAIMNYYCLQVTGGEYHTWPLHQFPAFLFLFRPVLALGDYYTAMRVFFVVNHVMLLGSIVCLATALKWGTTARKRAVIVLTWFLIGLLSLPINDTLNRGQLNILVLFLLCAFLLAAVRKRGVAASLLLSLAVVTKTVPVLLILPLGIRGRHRWWLGALAWFGLFSALAFVALPELTLGWWHLSRHRLGEAPWLGLDYPDSQSWSSALARMFFSRAGTPPPYEPLLWESPELGTFLILFMTAMVWVVTLLVLYQGRRDPHQTLLDDVALVLCAAGSGISYNWFHHHTWLLIPVMVFWKRVLETNRVFSLPGFALLASSLALALFDGPIYRGLFFMRIARYHFLIGEAGAFAATLLLAVGVALRNATAWDHTKASQEESG